MSMARSLLLREVIIPGIPALEFGGSLKGLPVQPVGSSMVYRAAMSFTCRQPLSMQEAVPIEFSLLAIVDFQLKELFTAKKQAASEVRIVHTEPETPHNADEGASEKAKRYLSQSCPRFVPSKQGAELIFVSEDVAPSDLGAPWAASVDLPRRLLAQMQLLETSVEGKRRLTWQNVAPEASEALARGAEEISVKSRMLKLGEHEMPFAPVVGCPEFVAGLVSELGVRSCDNNMFM